MIRFVPSSAQPARPKAAIRTRALYGREFIRGSLADERRIATFSGRQSATD
jgi:hypothetical protein